MNRSKVVASIPPATAIVETRLRRVLTAMFRILLVIAVIALAVFAVRYEGDHSWLQAKLFSRVAAEMTYELGTGPAPLRAFAPSGPFDVRRGYTQLPDFEARLTTAGMRVARQARASARLHQLTRRGITPPYRESQTAALQIRAGNGELLYAGGTEEQAFDSIEEIPTLLSESLLFMENKQLLTPDFPTQNPTIEWRRLGKATLSYFGEALHLSGRVEGGSTLATQLEKFRHSSRGRTSSGREKLRQLVSASIKSYGNGPDTTARRREIVVEYFNSIPLAAVPGYGEVYGLGAGLNAWFGMSLTDVAQALSTPGESPEKAIAYKHAMALIAALQAPYKYLTLDRPALERRLQRYFNLLSQEEVITPGFAAQAARVPLQFRASTPAAPPPNYRDRKAVNALRTHLESELGVANLYDLDRLDLKVESTFDMELQRAAHDLLRDLSQADYVREHGLMGERLLRGGDPSKVLYSLLLYERTGEGNELRVQIDNLNKPLDLNRGIKLELGSTAKLRTLAHYLEIMALLYRDLANQKPEALSKVIAGAHDPLTSWAAETLRSQPDADIYSFLEAAMQRSYSGSPGGSFFTGGGLHFFNNFDHDDDGRVLPLIEAFRRSTNLVFIRVMKDLVQFHRARLPYDADAVLDDPDNPVRLTMLDEIANDEARSALRHGYARFHGVSKNELVAKLLGARASAPRKLAVLFFAWHVGQSPAELEAWLRGLLPASAMREVDSKRLWKAYSNPNLTISDYGFLLGRHPLEVWAAGELSREPQLSWDELYQRSGEVRQTASGWLYKTRNRRAQDRRLRVRIEEDAFARMTPYWRQLGFPFRKLVPSYATAIGNSSDRPAALADLMGIIVNNGWRRPTTMVRELRFAESTPYETQFRVDNPVGEKVMEVAVARTLQMALSEVAQHGTARAISGVFVRPDGTPATVGGKTGTGDNRFRTFAHGGAQRSSRVLNRTATFVFYIDDRYFGVLTAFVPGADAAQFSYTSSLAVNVLKLLAPEINKKLGAPLAS